VATVTTTTPRRPVRQRSDLRSRPGLTSTQYAIGLAAILLVAATLRLLFPVADPPWFSPVGVVWHDEGAWVHNARNRALAGAWVLAGDRWNPMFITPVLTGLEFLSFSAFGVGLWQARAVSEVMGTLSVLLLGLGVARVGGRPAGLAAGALLATNFVAVSYDRAALMEATMVSLIVASWYCYARSADSARWGIAAGAAAVGAFFTKASAVFFLAALAGDAMLTIALERGVLGGGGTRDGAPADRRVAGAWNTLVGLAGAGLASLAVFVMPRWQEYRFYNWQMSVLRKPAYSPKALLDRLTWFPVIHDLFTRMWVVLAAGLVTALGLLGRWRRVAPAERLLASWLVLGTTELVLHDIGNERRFVFLIPALVALASLTLLRDRCLVDEATSRLPFRRTLLAVPIVLAFAYVLAGPLVRVPFLDDLHANVFRQAVRWSGFAAAVLCAALYVRWSRTARLLARVRWGLGAGLFVVVGVMGMDLRQYAQWASIRTSKNYEAMLAVGRWLPPGTLVHGKLANGLALESRITPIFVGRGFGNYEDRASRTDIRYLLTYLRPSFGYESQARNPVTSEILAACPGWRIVREFDVAESPGGHDRAALIDKYPDRH
jgi:hypothetical protein